MLFKLVIFAALAFILFSLGQALYYMMTDKQDSKKFGRALAWRVGLSVALFAGILVGLVLGWIEPPR